MLHQTFYLENCEKQVRLKNITTKVDFEGRAIETNNLFYLFRSNDSTGMKRSSSFHAYYAMHSNENRTEDLNDPLQNSPEVTTAFPAATENNDERRTSRVQFKEDIEDNKAKEETKDDNETEIDMEAEFAGVKKTMI